MPEGRGLRLLLRQRRRAGQPGDRHHHDRPASRARGPLELGPARKTPSWRGASALVGWALFLLLVDWVAGSLISFIGTGRLIASLIVAGIAMSVPYGTAWMRGREPPPEKPAPPAPAAEVSGEAGSTYVIVQTRPGRAVRARELGAGAYALYSLFWRGPVALGDYALTGLWRIIARLWGVHPAVARRRNGRGNGRGGHDTPEALEGESPDSNLF